MLKWKTNRTDGWVDEDFYTMLECVRLWLECQSEKNSRLSVYGFSWLRCWLLYLFIAHSRVGLFIRGSTFSPCASPICQIPLLFQSHRWPIEWCVTMALFCLRAILAMSQCDQLTVVVFSRAIKRKPTMPLTLFLRGRFLSHSVHEKPSTFVTVP